MKNLATFVVDARPERCRRASFSRMAVDLCAEATFKRVFLSIECFRIHEKLLLISSRNSADLWYSSSCLDGWWSFWPTDVLASTHQRLHASHQCQLCDAFSRVKTSVAPRRCYLNSDPNAGVDLLDGGWIDSLSERIYRLSGVRNSRARADHGSADIALSNVFSRLAPSVNGAVGRGFPFVRSSSISLGAASSTG